MQDQNKAARICSIIEEELGELPLFANVSAAEIEALAARLTRGLASHLGLDLGGADHRKAA